MEVKNKLTFSWLLLFSENFLPLLWKQNLGGKFEIISSHFQSFKSSQIFFEFLIESEKKRVPNERYWNMVKRIASNNFLGVILPIFHRIIQIFSFMFHWKIFLFPKNTKVKSSFQLAPDFCVSWIIYHFSSIEGIKRVPWVRCDSSDDSQHD